MGPKECLAKKTPDISLHACPDAQRGITPSALKSKMSTEQDIPKLRGKTKWQIKEMLVPQEPSLVHALGQNP